MGIGKQKSNLKRAKRGAEKAKRRNNNAQIIAAAELNAPQEDREVPKTITGRQRHQEKVEQKRKIREMLNYKKAERLGFKKSSTDGDEKCQRRALCDEIKVLRQHMTLGESVAPGTEGASMEAD